MYFGTGRFKNLPMLASLEFSHQHRDYFLNNNYPASVETINIADPVSKLGFVLCECQVAVVLPLVHNERLIGIVGLGEKVNKRPYDETDHELLALLANSVTPFIANSFLFEEIAELNRWHLEILNSVRQGVYVFDECDQLVTINQAGYEILKSFKWKLPGPGSLVHVPISWIFHAAVFPGWANRLVEAGHGRHQGPLKNLVAQSSGTEYIFSVRVSRVAGEEEDERGYVVTLEDVTAQRENERRMFNLERFADKGVMASSIAHEMNNHLAMLMGGVELADANLGKGKTDKAIATLTKLKNNVMKMRRFTSGLMDYGKLETRKEVGDLNSVITDVLSFVAVQKRFAGISVKTNLSQDVPAFEFDSDQISQLLLNLLNNAVDAVRESKAASGEIQLTTGISDQTVTLAVSDNGGGMTDDVKERLFESHLTTKKDGHGYGLVTCSKIIKNHNGSVAISSRVGKGSEFMIEFPLDNMTDGLDC
jgi:signal transduction histidine kinase